MPFNPNKPESAQAIFRFPLFPDPPVDPKELPEWVRNHLVPAFAAAFDDHTHTFPLTIEGQLAVNAMTSADQLLAKDAGQGAMTFQTTDTALEVSDGTDWLRLLSTASAFAIPAQTYGTTYAAGSAITAPRTDSRLLFPSALMPIGKTSTAWWFPTSAARRMSFYTMTLHL